MGILLSITLSSWFILKIFPFDSFLMASCFFCYRGFPKAKLAKSKNKRKVQKRQNFNLANFIKIVNIFQENHLSLDSVDFQGQSVLFIVAGTNLYKDTVQTLIGSGANELFTDSQGDNCLHHSARLGLHVAFGHFLACMKKADNKILLLQQPNKEGKTPIDLLKKSASKEAPDFQVILDSLLLKKVQVCLY